MSTCVAPVTSPDPRSPGSRPGPVAEDSAAGPSLQRLSGWGRTGSVGCRVLRVRTPDEVAHALGTADQRGVLPRGLARSYGDAAQNAGGCVLDMTGLDHLEAIDREAATVRAGAGVALGRVLAAALSSGFVLPVLPGTASVTVGGALASDVHGKNHVHEGSFATHVASFTLMLASGERRTVTRADHDVFWSTAGGMGLTGIVLDAVLQLRPVETTQVLSVRRRCEDIEALLAATATAAADHEYAVAWVDLGARGAGAGRGVVEGGDHAGVADLPADRRQRPLRQDGDHRVTVPAGWPSGVVSWPAVRALGAARWARAPRRAATRLRPLARFLHPLDGVSDWNRLYGRPGLVQYQLAVPDGTEELVAGIVRRVAAGPAACPVAVLKRLGPQPGLLSFPLAGWTLALDFPADAPRLHHLLAELDDRVAGCGGRVYLAKDSRLRPGTLIRMYPRLAEWQAVRRSLDPTGVLISDLARRTGLATAGDHRRA